MGFWDDYRPLLSKHREYLIEKQDEFLDIALKATKGYNVHMQNYKKLKLPEGLANECIPWYTMRTFSVYKELTALSEQCSKDLPEQIRSAYLQFAPLYLHFAKMRQLPD